MRMWMVDPKMMCRQHLLGEHNEIHKHRHVFIKKYSIKNRVKSGNIQIEPESTQKRHDELAQEMLKRGYNHKSPYTQPDISHLPDEQRKAKVDKDKSAIELTTRCKKCWRRHASIHRS